MNQPVITVSRQFGSGGHSIALALAERLGVPFYDKEIVLAAAEKVVTVRIMWRTKGNI